MTKYINPYPNDSVLYFLYEKVISNLTKIDILNENIQFHKSEIDICETLIQSSIDKSKELIKAIEKINKK